MKIRSLSYRLFSLTLFLFAFLNLTLLCSCSGSESLTKDVTPPPTNSSSDGNNGSGGGNNQSLLTYCSQDETAASAEKGDGPKADVQWLNNKYPKPDPYYLFDSKTDVTQTQIGGQDVLDVNFKINPFQSNYSDAGDNIFEVLTMRTAAHLVIPLNLKDKESLVFSINTGTANGLPPPEDWDLTNPHEHDPVYSADQTPDYFRGTKTSDQFQETYERIAIHFGVPILIYDSVPGSVVFTTDFEKKLRAYHELESPNYTCDDLDCGDPDHHGAGISKDGLINRCLTALAFVDSSQRDLLHYHSGNFYALANDRAIDAAQAVLNQMTQLGGGFDISKAVFIGGSKRGIAARSSLITLDRAVAAQSGHSNAGSYLQMYASRANLFSNEPDNFYKAAGDKLNFLNTFPLTNDWLNRYDPIYWSSDLFAGKQLFITWGGNDTFFATGAELNYSAALPDNTRYLELINYPHGGGTVSHAVAFYSLLADIFNDQPMPQIQAHLDVNQNQVTAVVSNRVPETVELWCSDHMTDRNIISLRTDKNTCASIGSNYKANLPDARYAAMASVPMTQIGSGIYQADIPASSAGGDYDTYRDCVVRATSISDDFTLTSKTLFNKSLCDESLLNTATLSN